MCAKKEDEEVVDCVKFSRQLKRDTDGGRAEQRASQIVQSAGLVHSTNMI